MKIINIIAVLGMVFLSSCSLWKASDWNAYKVIIEVQDESGQVIPDVTIQSAGMEGAKTNQLGRVTLYYYQTGLHVVTCQATGMLTEQFRLNIPGDANKVVTINLESKIK